MIGTEAEKEKVLPILLDGEPNASFPGILQGRVFADFRDHRSYFSTAFNLIVNLFEIPSTHRAVADISDSLRRHEIEHSQGKCRKPWTSSAFMIQ